MNRPVQHNTNALGLYIPDQTLSEAEATFSRPKEAERWIAELPIASVGETSRLVYKALAQLNRTAITPQNRIKILELLREPVQYITDSLKKHFIGQPFPLSVKTRKIAELTQELQWEMANGYKIIVDASLSSFQNRIDGKMLLLSLGRSLHYLGLSLLKSYQIYAATPDRLWLELHHLYLFAEHNGLHNKRYRDKLEKGNAPLTVLSEYKKILLLALANPYRLPQAEIEKVYNHLDNWCDNSELFFFDQTQPSPGMFAVNLELDAPPSYAAESNENTNPQLIRILDTSDVARLARNELIALDEAQTVSPPPLSQETLRRLVLALGGMPKRSFSRVGKNTPVSIALGLSATHYFTEHSPLPEAADKLYRLSPENMEKTDSKVQFSDSQFLSPATFSSRGVATPEHNSNLPDIWDMAPTPSFSTDSGGTQKLSIRPFLSDLDLDRTVEAESTPKTSPDQQQIYTKYECQMTDESVGGCRLHWRSDEVTKTVVGQLIGIQNSQENREREQWSIGVIRWMKTHPETGMEMGIEILAPHAVSLATRNITHKSRLGFFVRSMLLPELRAINQPQTLLTPPSYSVGDKIEVHLGNSRFRVRLTKLLEQTGTFSQFQFIVLKPSKMKPETGKLDRIKNFDSIWSSI